LLKYEASDYRLSLSKLSWWWLYGYESGLSDRKWRNDCLSLWGRANMRRKSGSGRAWRFVYWM